MRTKSFLFIVVLIMICMLSLLIFSISLAETNYKCGQNATWSLNGTVLTIRGTGKMYDYTTTNEPPWHAYICEKLGRTWGLQGTINRIIIEEGITYIGNYTFKNPFGVSETTNLQYISLPSSLEEIGKMAFWGFRMSSIIFPENVKTINQSAFYDSLLEKIYIPSSISLIDTSAFSNCGSLTDVYYEGTTKDWEKINIKNYNDYLLSATKHYNFDSKGQITYAWSSDNRLVTATRSLPEFGLYESETAITYRFSSTAKTNGVSRIAVFSNPAFSAEKKLNTLILPDGITKVEEEAFMNNNFEAIIIPSSCKVINNKAFANNKNLQIVIAIDVERASDAFDECDDVFFVDNSENIVGDYIYSTGNNTYYGLFY